MNQSQGQVAANVEASLTGEKPMATVHFVRTGDTETTILNGCLAVIREVGSSLGDPWDSSRVFGYLQARYRPVSVDWKLEEKKALKFAEMKSALLKAQSLQRAIQGNPPRDDDSSMEAPTTPTPPYASTNIGQALFQP